ncbi:MAG: MATE family efflux transporter [Thermoguttaceae bacterium]
MQSSPQSERTRRLAEDPVPRLLLRLSLPAMVGMMTQGAYYFVDRVFVGQALNPDALAGITMAFPYMLVLLAAAMLIGFGAAAQVSIKLGEKKTDDAERVLGGAALTILVLSVVLTIVGQALLDPVLHGLGISPDVFPYTHDYLQILIFATGFQLVGFGLNAVIRAEGNARTAMWTLLIGVFLNFFLAWLFLFRFQWGMRGAALATAIAQCVSAVWVLAYFLQGKSVLRLHWRHLRFHVPTCSRILLIGSPMFLMQLFGALMFGFVNHQAGAYGGVTAIAVWGGIYALFMVANMPVYGINQGTQPIVGFNYGAKRFDRVKQALLTGILYASTLTALGFAVAMFLPRQVMELFINAETSNRSALIELAVHAMRLCFLLSPLVGFQVVSASYFQATGKPREATLLMLSRQVFLLIPLVWILPLFFQLDGVWMALPISDGVSSLVTGACLLFELRRLDDRHQQATVESAKEPVLATEDLAVPEDAA